MKHKTFFWFVLPSSLAMLLFIFFPLISIIVQSVYVDHDQVIVTVENCGPFGCTQSTMIDQEATAALMIAAMIQAAKSDGVFDDNEREKLLNHLDEADADEAAFVQAQMAAPVDVDALVAQTPDGMGPQIYAMSLLAIDLDTQEEAQYLHKLASAYGMQIDEVNEIHEQMGVPSLYT